MFDLDPHAAKSPFVAGFLGALVALRGVPGASWKERIANTISGSLMAGFLTPALAEYFALHSAEIKAAMAFAIGLFGLNLMAAILTFIKNANIGDYIPWKRGGQ